MGHPRFFVVLAISVFLVAGGCCSCHTSEVADRGRRVKETASFASLSRGGAASSTTPSLVRSTPKKVTAKFPTFVAFLYFLAGAFAVPVVPKIVNEIVSGGSVTQASVTIYGTLQSIDAFFTFFTSFLYASLSDKFGRRPFMILSSLGLGVGFSMVAFARRIWVLMVAAAIDGCTSCMYSQAQAAVSDCVDSEQPEKLGEAFGVFQGLAIGVAFMIGLPLGGILGQLKGLRFPLGISVGLCLVNVAITAFTMPETLSESKRKEKVNIYEANPFGAAKLFGRTRTISSMTMCWLFLVSITSLSDILLPFFWNTDKFDPNPRYRQWIAHGGLQINFINFTSVMGWSMGQSGGALAMMGLLVAAVPKLVLPLLGVRASIFIGLLVYSISQMLLGSAFLLKTAAQRTMAVYAGIALVSLGTVSLPAILSLLVSQVAADEQGAVQGLADTTKVLTTMLATPFMAAFFGKCIGLEDSLARGGSFFLGAGLSGVACIIAVLTFGAESLFSREHEVAKRSKK